mmetsp:Transcript_53638/g.96391  ORF Transcript_53638/g.96391 Transcript_53638/m.96391 type:complete len:147 (-) Transcript_53638:2-442(-)
MALASSTMFSFLFDARAAAVATVSRLIGHPAVEGFAAQYAASVIMFLHDRHTAVVAEQHTCSAVGTGVASGAPTETSPVAEAGIAAKVADPSPSRASKITRQAKTIAVCMPVEESDARECRLQNITSCTEVRLERKSIPTNLKLVK